MSDNGQQKTVLIIGSGPVGCTFARVLVKAGLNVTMVEAGPSHTGKPADNTGAHLKNSDIFQRNINLFSGVIKSHLVPLSVPSRSPETAIDPATYQYKLNIEGKGTVQNGQNPDQKPEFNLGGAAVAYGVGGMATHWTCAVPQAQVDVPAEYIQVLHDPDATKNRAEMARLYSEAEALVHKSNKEFDGSKRQKAILAKLKADPAYKDAQPLPLAAMRENRPEQETRRVYWSGPEVILKGGVAYPENSEAKSIVTDPAPGSFRLLPEHQCRKLKIDSNTKTIVGHDVINLATGKAPLTVPDKFDYYVVAAGAILTPQLLWASGIRPRVAGEAEAPVLEAPSVGKFMCEQTMAFCQVILSQELVASIGGMQGNDHQRKHASDPVPIPFDDPEPNLWVPVKAGREWHCQIHRDAFHYGTLPPNVDSRLVVDLRWFSTCDTEKENRVEFSTKKSDAKSTVNTDLFGMPQPTFHFKLSDKDQKRAHDMMADLVHAAGLIGGFLPQSEPCFLDPGFALHVTGTTRLADDKEHGVVDRQTMAVFEVDNLYLGGGGVIPTGMAGNTTLTMTALAVRAAEFLAAKALSKKVTYQLAKHKQDPANNPEVKIEAGAAGKTGGGKTLVGAGSSPES